MEKPNTGGGFFDFLRRLFGGSSSKPAQPASPAPVTPPTNGGMRFGTTMDRNNATMLSQLQAAQQYRPLIEEAARRYNIQPAVICGIGSRESHWGLALKPAGPSGRGDFAKRSPRGARRTQEPPDGPGYGRGLMQIDYDWHEFARTGQWWDARQNILYACELLDKNRTFFRQRTPRLNAEEQVRAMLAAYNGGATATLRAIEAGLDIDANTTGRDYARDALNRSGWFQLHGWG